MSHPAIVAAVLLGLLSGNAARAETISVAATKGIEVAPLFEAALRELSGLTVRRGKAAVRASWPACKQDGRCFAGVADPLGTDFAVLASISGDGPSVELMAAFVDVARNKVARAERQVDRKDLKEAVRAMTDELLPAYLRKGFGGLELAGVTEAVVKVDGRSLGTVSAAAPVAVTSGSHWVDVVPKEGPPYLESTRIADSSVAALTPRPFAALAHTERAPPRTDVLRTSAYVTWAAGAVLIAGSLVAGTLSRTAQRDLAPCGDVTRDCLTLERAEVQQRRAMGYARAGNVLLISGSLFAATGAGLFAVDAWRGRGEP